VSLGGGVTDSGTQHAVDPHVVRLSRYPGGRQLTVEGAGGWARHVTCLLVVHVCQVVRVAHDVIILVGWGNGELGREIQCMYGTESFIIKISFLNKIIDHKA